MAYHTREIKKGIFGEVSKISEEYDEYRDNNNSIMLALCELSDYYGALIGFFKKNYPNEEVDFNLYEVHNLYEETYTRESINREFYLSHERFIDIVNTNNPNEIINCMFDILNQIDKIARLNNLTLSDIRYFSHLTTSAFLEGKRK